MGTVSLFKRLQEFKPGRLKDFEEQLGERRGVRNLQNEGSDQGVYDHQNRLAEKCRSGYAGNA